MFHAAHDHRRGACSCDALPKESIKERKDRVCGAIKESKRMATADAESGMDRAVRASFDLAPRSFAAADAADPPRTPLFRNGQSVCWYWAPWFKDCTKEEMEGRALQGRTGGKARPTWFAAEILRHVGHTDDMYMGYKTLSHRYNMV